MVSEARENLTFVQIVEKYPCLYDSTIPEYAKRDLCEASWKAIAKETNLPANVCKDKWRNLRTAFARAQKKSPSGVDKGQRKSYYLWDSMSFILPYLKTRDSVCISESPNDKQSVSAPPPATEKAQTHDTGIKKGIQQDKEKELPRGANQDFLNSLLPDMEKLSNRRRRRFQRLTLELLDELLNEQEDEEIKNHP
ncbi:transcription factor Adf-1-like [Ischnura elegans]|uniref:transcription factor Adf-1-like n=1 Tax=Ischnura elegans TaxID=197161 RepID=UPI001ED88F5D|nr:transcription factor Adf-1-like [Ischnura elegans]